MTAKPLKKARFKIYREINGKINDKIKTMHHSIENNTPYKRMVQLQIGYDINNTPLLSTQKFSP